MIELRLFGPVELRNRDGALVTELLRRPNRLALLAYLAAGRPHGLHRRDTLLGLFWPESPAKRARAALNQALFVVRNALGSDVIETRGDGEVGIPEGRVWSDVAAFEEATGDERFEDAIGLYRGEFLEGFYLRSAPEFEKWVDGERDRTRRAAVDVCLSLTRRCRERGDMAGATRWAERGTALAPYEEASARALLEVLADQGKRARAIRAFEAFAKRLAADIGISPSPELRSLLDGIKQPPATVPTPPADMPAGPAEERYKRKGKLGEGGMSLVYLAEDLRYGRDVAIKITKAGAYDETAAKRFEREIGICAVLNHPNIVPLLDSGVTADALYLVTPFVRGGSLRQRMEMERQLPIGDVLQLARELAAALDYAHEDGIVHRDVKPENVLLHEGVAMLTDFGIAHQVECATQPPERLTPTGIGIGTPEYMSPEQATGEPIDGRTDVYSLGCVLFELLGGEPPYTGATTTAVIARKLTEPVPSLRLLRDTVPERMEQAIAKALARAPADRFSSAGELAAALEAAREPERPAVRWIAAVAILVAVVVGGPKVWDMLFDHDPIAERAWVLVADFDGPSDDPELGIAVRELVSAELNQSKYFSAVPRTQLRTAMQNAGIPDSARVGVELATNLALRSAVRVIFYGSVRPIGGTHYSIILHAISTEDGSNLLSRNTMAELGEGIIRSVEQLVRIARRELGERREDIEANRPLVNVATPSLPAFLKLVEATVLEGEGQAARSRGFLLEAVKLDTAFASAWTMLASNYLTARKSDSAVWASREALRYPDRLTPAQEYRLRADVAYNIEYDLPEAVRWYERTLDEDPTSISARNNLGVYLSSMGRHEEAVEQLALAITVDPFLKGPRQLELLNLGAELLMVGRLDSARVVFGRLKEPYSFFANLVLPASTDDWPTLERLSRGYAERSDAPRHLHLFASTGIPGGMAGQGAVLETERLLAQSIAAAKDEDALSYARARVLLALVSGRTLPDLPGPLARDTTPGGRVLSGLWETARGDPVALQQLRVAVEAWDDVARRRMGPGPTVVEALAAVRSGDPRRAVEILGPAAFEGEHDAFSLDRVDGMFMRWIVARAYDDLGLADSAAAYLELVLDPTRMAFMHYPLRGIPYPFAHYRLARLYERRGMPDRALEHWQALIETLSQPDTETEPLRKEAEAAVRRLEGSQ
jgi:serine/threonine-protein kinase